MGLGMAFFRLQPADPEHHFGLQRRAKNPELFVLSCSVCPFGSVVHPVYQHFHLAQLGISETRRPLSCSRMGDLGWLDLTDRQFAFVDGDILPIGF